MSLLFIIAAIIAMAALTMGFCDVTITNFGAINCNKSTCTLCTDSDVCDYQFSYNITCNCSVGVNESCGFDVDYNVQYKNPTTGAWGPTNFNVNPACQEFRSTTDCGSNNVHVMGTADVLLTKLNPEGLYRLTVTLYDPAILNCNHTGAGIASNTSAPVELICKAPACGGPGC